MASSRFVDEDEVFAYALAVNRILEGHLWLGERGLRPQETRSLLPQIVRSQC